MYLNGYGCIFLMYLNTYIFLLFRGFPGSSADRNHLQCRKPQFDSWVRKIHWRRDRVPTPVFLSFPCCSAGKEPTHKARDLGSIPGLGKSSGDGKVYPLQYSGHGEFHGLQSMGSQRVRHDWVISLSVMNKTKGQIPAHLHHCLSVIHDNGRASVWKPKGEEIDSDW